MTRVLPGVDVLVFCRAVKFTGCVFERCSAAGQIYRMCSTTLTFMNHYTSCFVIYYSFIYCLLFIIIIYCIY